MNTLKQVVKKEKKSNDNYYDIIVNIVYQI